MPIVFLHNAFAAICKLDSVNFITGAESLLYEQYTDQNSSNITARNSPTFPRAIWITPSGVKYERGIATYPNIRIRFSVNDSHFLQMKPLLTHVEKLQFVENLAFSFWNRLLDTQYLGLGFGVINEASNTQTEQWRDGDHKHYWECVITFGVKCTVACPQTDTIRPDTPMPAPYAPLVPTFGNIPKDIDILNFKHYP